MELDRPVGVAFTLVTAPGRKGMSTSDIIQNYLDGWKRSQLLLYPLLACAALAGGLLVLLFTFWFTYAIIWFGAQGVSAMTELAFGKRFHIAHEIRLLGSGVFVLLLFVQLFRTDPSHWGAYPRSNYRGAMVPAVQYHMGATSMFWLLAYPRASANMIADLLLTGPRLVVGSVKLVRQTRRVREFDVNSCATLLAFLLGRHKVAPYEELRDAGWEPWFEQLRLVEGVRFLEQGILLSGELKAALGGGAVKTAR